MGVTRLIPVRMRPTCPPKDSLDYPIPANVLVELRMPEYIHTRENEPDESEAGLRHRRKPMLWLRVLAKGVGGSIARRCVGEHWQLGLLVYHQGFRDCDLLKSWYGLRELQEGVIGASWMREQWIHSWTNESTLLREIGVVFLACVGVAGGMTYCGLPGSPLARTSLKREEGGLGGLGDAGTVVEIARWADERQHRQKLF